MNSVTMQGRKKTNKKSTQKVVDGRTLGHQSKKRNTRNAGKPHRHVVEEEGSSTSAASSEHDTSCSSDYNSKAEESEGSELPVASSVRKEQNKAPSKRTPTSHVMYPSPPPSPVLLMMMFSFLYIGCLSFVLNFWFVLSCPLGVCALL
jgi:cobalamin biosynthesis Mg chelatase CobN